MTIRVGNCYHQPQLTLGVTYIYLGKECGWKYDISSLSLSHFHGSGKFTKALKTSQVGGIMSQSPKTKSKKENTHEMKKKEKSVPEVEAKRLAHSACTLGLWDREHFALCQLSCVSRLAPQVSCMLFLEI